MGNIVRPLKNWNALNRSIRRVEKEKHKAVRAPLHSDLKPESPSVDIHAKINPELQKAIDQFEILSEEIKQSRTSGPSDRPLPQKQMTTFNQGTDFRLPSFVPEGKLSLYQIVNLLEDYRGDVSIEDLADKYNLDVEKVSNLLQYNRLFVRESFKEQVELKTSQPKLTGKVESVTTTSESEISKKAPIQGSDSIILYPEIYLEKKTNL